MIKWLILHQWRAIYRSSIWYRKLASNIFFGLLIFLVILNLLGIGLNIDLLIKNVAPGKDPIHFINSVLLFFFGIDLLMRFMLQKIPGHAIQPYLHLPLRKSSLIHFLLVKSVGSLFNFLPLLIAVPVALKIIAIHSVSSAWSWLLTIFLILLFNSYLAVYLKRQFVVNAKSSLLCGAILISLVALDRAEIISTSGLSATLFSNTLANPLVILFLIAGLVGLYYLNFRFLTSHIYLDDISQSKKSSLQSFGRMRFLDRFGEVGDYLALELKLIFRNKRLNSALYMTPVLMLLGFAIYSQTEFRSFDFWLIYMGVFLTGMFMISYGQFVLSWESHYFDTILAKKVEPYGYFKAKFIIMLASCLIHYLVILPFAYFDLRILYANTALVLFNMGINSFILLIKATYNRRRIALDVTAFSMEGKDGKQFLVAFIFILLPFLIYLPFKLTGMPDVGFLMVGGVGTLGLVFSGRLLRFTVGLFKKQKYAIAAAFRQN